MKDIEIDRTKELKLLEKYKDIPIYRYSEMYPLMFSKTESYLNPLNNIELEKIRKDITRQLKDEILVTPKVKLVKKGSLPQSEGKAVRMKDLRNNK